MITSMENEIMIEKNSLQDIDWDSLTFSINPTRSMFVANCKEGGEWDSGELVPYGDIKISPASGVLNYGQGVFEGIKAFRSSKDRIVFFRLDRNAIRFYRSCKRLCIPPISIEMFMEAVEEVVRDNADYVPPNGKGSMYIRPVAWGTGPVLGVKPAPSYTFLVFVSPFCGVEETNTSIHETSQSYTMYCLVPMITTVVERGKNGFWRTISKLALPRRNRN